MSRFFIRWIRWDPLPPSRESPLARIKRLLLGHPFQSVRAKQERVSILVGLGAFASDAISSVAYATEEMLLVLFGVEAAALSFGAPITVVITALMMVVLTSYYQTVHAYPAGGGAYNVARENLGLYPALIAAASLVVDYVLTVAVSVAAGVAAITSAFPALHEHRVALALAFVLLLTLGNLRGIREAGYYFSLPTYFFILSVLWVIGNGIAGLVMQGRTATDFLSPVIPTEPVSAVGWWVILRAFSSGSVAMTGVEAIANAVPVFRDPPSRHAGTAMIWLGVTLATLFLGVTFLALDYGIQPRPDETVLSQLSRAVLDSPAQYHVVQAATALILLLAANTSYTDFPRVASLLGRDRFLPQQLAHLGDRLVFSNGILLLSAMATVLLVIFRADTDALIPLYAVGVFLAFTISQAGMLVRWFRRRDPGWRWRAAINGIGALLTGTVLVVIAMTKFIHGAWVVLVIIPALVSMFLRIHLHYKQVGRQLAVHPTEPPRAVSHTVLVPISGITRPVLTALEFARSLSPAVRAVYINTDAAAAEQIQSGWERWKPGIDLIILESPYRSIIGPLLDYIDQVQKERENGLVIVVLPEFVPRRWWHHLLHNQTALLLKGALLFRRDVVVTSVPYHLNR
ncbi:MAG: APC family permease [Nitrospirae bacterium]|nr:APC family permease [Nitrospirota bacterium]